MNNTSLQVDYANNLTLAQELLGDGLRVGRLDVLDQINKKVQMVEQEKEFIMLKMLNEFLELNKSNAQILSVTQESVPIIKKKILNDKKISLNNTIQILKSSKISDLDLTGIDKDLDPFWNKHTLEMSKKLWLPTKTDCVDLDTNLLNGSSRNLMLNSWYSVKMMTSKMQQENFQKTYLQSLPCLLQKTTECEQRIIKKKENSLKLQPAKAIKINIKLSKEQRKTITKWFGLRRFIYNKCVSYVKEQRLNDKNFKLSLKDLRKKIINNENYKIENTWVLDYEYDLRDEALRDFLKNVKSNLSKQKNFEIKFKSRKSEKIKNESISVLSKKWNKKNNFYSSIFNPKKLKSSEIIPDKLTYDSRLIKTPSNKYYLCIPKPLEIKSDNQALNSIFIDPGVKNFITGYDPNGKIVIFGKRDVSRISRLLHYKRKLISKISKITKHKKRYTHKKALIRLNEKIYNLINELHKKLSKWLCENYNFICIPRLNFHKCKKLNKRSRELMASLRHCSFIDRLHNKAREYTFVKVYEANEAFTSKTCSNCGNVKDDLKNNDIYKCNECLVVLERDINASRNIMLRFLTKRAEFINSAMSPIS